VDEPTLLLFPDVAALDADDLALVQQAALAQCGRLKDCPLARNFAMKSV